VQSPTPHAILQNGGGFKMIRLRWPVAKKSRKAIRLVHCYHCAKPFFVSNDNTRAYNFCSECK
jgi:hypothetical protein